MDLFLYGVSFLIMLGGMWMGLRNIKTGKANLRGYEFTGPVAILVGLLRIVACGVVALMAIGFASSTRRLDASLEVYRDFEAAVQSDDASRVEAVLKAHPGYQGLSEVATRAVSQEKLNAVKVFLTHGIKAGPQTSLLTYGLSLSRAPSANMLALLVHETPDVNVADNSGYTPLLQAASRGYPTVVEYLLVRGADVKARNRAGSDALHLAAAEGRQDLCEMLVAAGADVNGRDNAGRTPLDCALKSFRGNDAAAWLRAHGAVAGAPSR